MRNQKPAYAAAIGANFIFGSSFASIKFLTPGYLPPLALNGVRVLTSIVLFWLLYLFFKPKVALDRKDLPRFLACAITGIAINQVFFVKGLSLTSAIHSSLLSLATPIFITIVAAIVLKEGFTRFKALGLLSGVSGATLLVLSKDLSQTGTQVWLGDLLILINAISYAVYLVLVRPLMEKYAPIQVLRWVFTFGAFFILPLAWTDLGQTDWTRFDAVEWTALAWVAVGATFGAYLLTVYSVSLIGSAQYGAFIYTQPVFAAIVAMLFAGETYSWTKALAAGLIFMGVWLVNKKQAATDRAPILVAEKK